MLRTLAKMTYFAKTPKFLFERRPDVESAHDCSPAI
jgi:hypothetical protein